MRRELMSRDPYDPPGDPAVLVEVTVEEYGFSRYLVVHRSGWCTCPREHTGPSRRWHRALKVHGLRDLLQQVWPHDAPPGFSTRDLARRVTLAACRPPLPVLPYHRTLIKERNPMTKIPVIACPDATGKLIVHDPGCGHAARLRAMSNGTGVQRTVGSLVELAHDLLKMRHEELADPEQVEGVLEEVFEVRQCTPLPVHPDPEEESFEEQAGKAVLRAYSALVALATTAATYDAERARDLTQRLEQRHATTSVGRRPSANLTTGDVREHLVASSECAAWVGVRAGAVEELADDASDMEKAKRWVATSRAMVRRFEQQWLHGGEEGGTSMGRAFAQAEEEGRRRFVTRATDALHEVAELMERRGTW